MSDALDRWANDIEGPPLEQWTANRFYRRALEMGITDPRVVANAAALLDVVEKFSDRHPHVPFDHCVEAVLSGLDESSTLRYTELSRWKYLKLRWKRFRRKHWG
jgi:hypothetical protein